MFFIIHSLFSILKCDLTLLLFPIYGTSHILLRITIILLLIFLKKTYQVSFLIVSSFSISIMPKAWTSLLLPIFHFSYNQLQSLSIKCPKHLNLFFYLYLYCICHSLGLTISCRNSLVFSISILVPE